jgi:hypothetical protein
MCCPPVPTILILKDSEFTDRRSELEFPVHHDALGFFDFGVSYSIWSLRVSASSYLLNILPSGSTSWQDVRVFVLGPFGRWRVGTQAATGYLYTLPSV